MAQNFATGAIHIFTRFGGTGSPLYFGTTESMPQDSRNPEYEMLMNDISGSKVPMDLAYEGESAQISLVMTRWDEDLANSITISPGSNIEPGSWSWNDVGTLMGLESQYTELWLVRQYGANLGAKAAYTSQGLKTGRYYPQCVLWAPQQDEQGTKPMKRHFMFFAWPKMDVPNKKFMLWSDNASYFSSINNGLIT